MVVLYVSVLRAVHDVIFRACCASEPNMSLTLVRVTAPRVAAHFVQFWSACLQQGVLVCLCEEL